MDTIAVIHKINRAGGKLCRECNSPAELITDRAGMTMRVPIVDSVTGSKHTWIRPATRSGLCYYHQRKWEGELALPVYTHGRGNRLRGKALPGRMGL